MHELNRDANLELNKKNGLKCSVVLWARTLLQGVGELPNYIHAGATAHIHGTCER